MDDEELALFFAAKNENEELREKLKDYEELKAQIERLTTNMNSIVVEMGKMEDYRRILDSNIMDRDHEICTLKSFIIDLDRYPKFWAKSYRIYIDRFINEQGIEY